MLHAVLVALFYSVPGGLYRICPAGYSRYMYSEWDGPIKGQDLVLEGENWRSPEREQTPIDDKLMRSVEYSQPSGPIPKG